MCWWSKYLTVLILCLTSRTAVTLATVMEVSRPGLVSRPDLWVLVSSRSRLSKVSVSSRSHLGLEAQRSRSRSRLLFWTRQTRASSIFLQEYAMTSQYCTDYTLSHLKNDRDIRALLWGLIISSYFSYLYEDTWRRVYIRFLTSGELNFVLGLGETTILHNLGMGNIVTYIT